MSLLSVLPWFEIGYSAAATMWVGCVVGPAFLASVRGERLDRIPGDW